MFGNLEFTDFNNEVSEESLRHILEKFDDSVEMDIFINYPCENQSESISQINTLLVKNGQSDLYQSNSINTQLRMHDM